MRNHLAILFPHFDFFMSTANEEATLDSIEDMGHNLAEEVRNHIVSKHLAIERIRCVTIISCMMVASNSAWNDGCIK